MAKISGVVKLAAAPVKDALVTLLETGLVFYVDNFEGGTFDDTVKVAAGLQLEEAD